MMNGNPPSTYDSAQNQGNSLQLNQWVSGGLDLDQLYKSGPPSVMPNNVQPQQFQSPIRSAPMPPMTMPQIVVSSAQSKFFIQFKKHE